MKTKFTMLLIAMVMFLASATAQEGENLKFLGIPITGNVNDFADKLREKGFRTSPNPDGIIILDGTFTNKDVKIGLMPIEGTNNIYRVGILYEELTSWDNLKSHYDYLVEAFTKKYGAPVVTIDKVPTIYKESGNFIISGIYREEVEFANGWNLPNGSIMISIEPFSADSANVMILYDDSKSKQTLDENIMNEI